MHLSRETIRRVQTTVFFLNPTATRKGVKLLALAPEVEQLAQTPLRFR